MGTGSSWLLDVFSGVGMDSNVVELVERWRQGDESAADQLYNRFTGRLLTLAGRNLSGKLQSRLDPEDVVQSACRTFFRRARDGQFQLEDDVGVWKLLVTITLNKIRNQVAHHSTQKRNASSEVSLSHAPDAKEFHIKRLSRDPSPLEVMVFLDELSQLHRCLGPREQKILELRLEGYSQGEIAQRLGVNERTIRRSIAEIRAHLNDWLHDD